ncbi:hypothetical protein SAMN04487968_1275 [Nocardioides terrae]|uniref:Uncharacterized protein n=1 Tax=Nocardioides terrae TaxID=574651 RepID=A0A1I1P498_9ACTN|nr:hypothetical protein [Nocardioides terrae]SFD04637.1 hypothetical protein SAMN04487968_1275 [Nocardioides terrae]
MSIHYAVMAATGVNDASKTLTNTSDDPLVCDTFAAAKEEVIARADHVLGYLVATDRNYAMSVESRDRQFEVRFEYGPASPEPDLPFQMVLEVCPCVLTHGRVEPVDLDRLTSARSLASNQSTLRRHPGREEDMT